MPDRSDQDARAPPAAGDQDQTPADFDGEASDSHGDAARHGDASDPRGDAPDDPSEALLERGPLEPGSPSLENAVFVLAGACGAVLLLLSAVL